jgi:cellulose biosynthesis protein BcsQ
LEADLYGIIKNDNSFTRYIPHRFEKSIRKYVDAYDFILIDTAPTAGSIVNALLMMSSDYFIAPASPSFFSLQAIDNLSTIFQSWLDLLGKYQTVHGFQGLSMNVKFLGLVVQLAKRYKGGGKRYTSQSEEWISDVNVSVNRFQNYALQRGKAITEIEFRKIFKKSEPFIIEKCCDFTPQLRSIAEKEGVPVINLTQDICRKHNKLVDITKENGQYKMSLDSIKESYNNIAQNLLNLLN